ncbi:MAG TPA: hypothetical protein VFS25_09635 [Chitinophaga sp.]|uniref:hypothetical protein n=1 Tax=Chitinophaga sp. TaxID=1869181 RepID=UPI002DBEAB5F|nr:hypothetical protein [Chitinophaga sp.]HEU4553086.1 hypothetical protein [Chitinophaga sp.]
MKKLLLLLWLTAMVAAGCATQNGCPANNFYTKSNKSENRKARKQMDSRVF